MRKTHLRTFLCVVLSFSLALMGCGQMGVSGSEGASAEVEQVGIENMSFSGLNDPALLQYTQDAILADLESRFETDDYQIADVATTYISKEYLEELEYNSRSNVYFGFTLEEIEEAFGNQNYVFTVDEDGQTVVQARELEGYDDSFNEIVRNLAVGGGVILVCVTVTAVTGGAGAPVAVQTIHTLFAASAETAVKFALSSAVMSGVAGAVITGYETGDFDQAMTGAAVSASQGFKWGAISGAIVGGASKGLELYKAGNGSSGGRPTYRESEKYVEEKLGGDAQASFKDGEPCSITTKGATRPDITRVVDGHLEAVEVKNYDLRTNFSGMKGKLVGQVTDRVANMPAGTTQRVVVDARGQGLSELFIDNAKNDLYLTLSKIDPSIVIEFLT